MEPISLLTSQVKIMQSLSFANTFTSTRKINNEISKEKTYTTQFLTFNLLIPLDK